MAEKSGANDEVIVLEFVSLLDANVDEIWRQVSTMKGVNFELHPFIHMTGGRNHQTLSAAFTPGEVIFRSWLLLFCVLPFDRHELVLDQLDDGRGFVEESRSLLQRRWRHERRLRPLADRRCEVVDRLVVEPRVRLSRPVVALAVRQLFAHRHRRLARRFGTTAP